MHHTHNTDLLAGALRDVIGVLNSPRQDDVLLREAGISLDRALFPLLVRIGASGALGVVELSEQVGRDHSTVSRQVGKLEDLGLVTRRPGKTDQRVREAVITPAGRRAVKAITAARRRLIGRLLADWSQADRDALARLSRKLADALLQARAR